MTKKKKLWPAIHLGSVYAFMLAMIIGYLQDGANSLINPFIDSITSSITGYSIDVDFSKLLISLFGMVTSHLHLGHWFTKN